MSADADKTMEQYELVYERLKKEMNEHDIDLQKLQSEDDETIACIVRALIDKRRELHKQLDILNEHRLQSFLLFRGANMTTPAMDSEFRSKLQLNSPDPKMRNPNEIQAPYENPSDADDESEDALNYGIIAEDGLARKPMFVRARQFGNNSKANFICTDSRTPLKSG